VISIAIPAYNEQKYLNKTIDNFLSTAKGEIEVIIVLNGYDQKVDTRAIVIKRPENIGMRKALNIASRIARGKYLMFIDAHCNITPEWDVKMLESLLEYPNGIIVAPITAINKDWSGKRGWYGFCEMRPNMQPVWRGKKTYGVTEPNMAVTGCGLLMAKSFYLSFGGLDENLPKMGAIGSEFSIHGWLNGDGIYTRTDVLLGHIFDTGGYSTDEVNKAQEILHKRWGHRYQEILKRFPEHQERMKMETKKEHRIVVVERKDEHVTTDDKTGKPIKKLIELFKYIYEDDGSGPSEEEIRKQYGPKAYKVAEELYYPTKEGKWIKVA